MILAGQNQRDHKTLQTKKGIMKFISHVLTAIYFGVFAYGAAASPANPQNGVDYRTLEKAQPTESVDKVEVTEFFWYSCPHCYEFDHPLTEWVKKQGNKIAFKRVPVAFRDSFVPQQKLYYTLESLGKLDRLHGRVFQAIHGERNRLDTDAAVVDWAVKQGLDKKSFSDLYYSFSTQVKANRATQLQNAYRVDGVPLVAIDGRYLTSPSIVGQRMKNQPESALHGATFQVMDWLVARAGKDKGQRAMPAMQSAPTKNQ